MKFYGAFIEFCFCAMLCHAQTAKTDQDFLTQIREKYDAPFNRNLQSFDCAVDFSWKEHFKNPATLVSVEQSKHGYKVAFKVQGSDIEMDFASDMRLQRGGMKSNPSDQILTSFESGPQGFLLTSLTMGEDGSLKPGNRLIYSFTYQSVDGVELPRHAVVIRESHHEVWNTR